VVKSRLVCDVIEEKSAFGLLPEHDDVLGLRKVGGQDVNAGEVDQHAALDQEGQIERSLIGFEVAEQDAEDPHLEEFLVLHLLRSFDLELQFKDELG
jgi:hypothetical protein